MVGERQKGIDDRRIKIRHHKPDDTEKVEGKYSLKMESQYVIVKFAAGNIFR